MTDIDLPALDRELKKGAAELLLLSVLEARPRHGYELGKLIETQSGGRLVFRLVISAVGIFGVIAYLITQQTRDIGIRMALGATRSRVMAAVFGQVGRLVAPGLILGGGVAWSLSNAAGRFLFGLDPRDGRAYAVAMITLVAAAFLAALLPARRAASVDPTQALRQE